MKSKICFQWCSGIKKYPPLSEQWITNIRLRHNQLRYSSRFTQHSLYLLFFPSTCSTHFFLSLSLYIACSPSSGWFWWWGHWVWLGGWKEGCRCCQKAWWAWQKHCWKIKGLWINTNLWNPTVSHFSHSLSLCCHYMYRKKRLSSNWFSWFFFC